MIRPFISTLLRGAQLHHLQRRSFAVAATSPDSDPGSPPDPEPSAADSNSAREKRLARRRAKQDRIREIEALATASGLVPDSASGTGTVPADSPSSAPRPDPKLVSESDVYRTYGQPRWHLVRLKYLPPVTSPADERRAVAILHTFVDRLRASIGGVGGALVDGINVPARFAVVDCEIPTHFARVMDHRGRWSVRERLNIPLPAAFVKLVAHPAAYTWLNARTFPASFSFAEGNTAAPFFPGDLRQISPMCLEDSGDPIPSIASDATQSGLFRSEVLRARQRDELEASLRQAQIAPSTTSTDEPGPSTDSST